MASVKIKIKTPYDQFRELVPDVYQPVVVTVLNIFGEVQGTYRRRASGYWFDANGDAVDFVAKISKAWYLEVEKV